MFVKGIRASKPLHTYRRASVQPSDWISLAALGVAALSTVVGPIITARLARRGRTDDERRAVYADVVRVLNDLFDAFPDEGPWGEERAAAAIAKLTLVASKAVQEKANEFFGLWRSFRHQAGDADEVRRTLLPKMVAVRNAMRDDLGIH
jgi:hypothetical protein